MQKIWIDQERCTLCELCIPVCVFGLLSKGDQSITVRETDKCILCGHCKAICPQDAPQMPFLNSTEFEWLPRTDDRLLAEQLLGLMRSRRSTRLFRRDAVEERKLQRVIEAARFAPTVLNRQPHHYVAIHTKEKLQEVRSLAIEALRSEGERIKKSIQKSQERGEPPTAQDRLSQPYLDVWREMAGLLTQGVDRLFYHAPAAILIHVNPSESRLPDLEAGLAVMQMLLMAEALGLGTCLCGFLSRAIEASPDLRSLLEIPPTHKIPVAFVVGVPDVQYPKGVSRNPARVNWL
jgi:nitroreductase/NAD-dependent dihydropyrimidine dehydrogenase PreA subunit